MTGDSDLGLVLGLSKGLGQGKGGYVRGDLDQVEVRRRISIGFRVSIGVGCNEGWG